MEKRNTESETNNTESENENNFEWSSRNQHIMFFLIYLLDYGGLGSHIYDRIYETEIGFPFVQFLIIVTVFAHPLLFFQTFIGQFTRQGCLFLGEMLPLTYGLGYSMIVVAIFRFTTQVFYTSMLVYYLLVSIFNSSPPWMKCFSSYYKLFPNCFSKTDIDLCRSKNSCDEPCFPPGSKVLSAYIFKEYSFLRLYSDKEEYKWFFTKGSIRALLHAAKQIIIYIPLIIIGCKTMKSIYTVLRIVVTICLVALLSILVVIFTRPGAFYGLSLLIDEAFSKELLLSYRSWLESFQMVAELLRLSEGGNILFGSFVPKSDPDPRRSIHLTNAFVSLTLVTSVYFYLFMGILCFKLNMKMNFLKSNEENAIFQTIPTFLGIQASAYFFSVIFYLVLTLLNFYSLAVKLVVLEKTITSHFNIRDYYFYVRLGICSMAFVFSSFVSELKTKQTFQETEYLFKLYELIAVDFQFLIMLLYGLQRIADDVEYLMKIKLSRFIRICWIAVPIISSATICLELTDHKYPYTQRMVLFASIISAPFLFCLTYKIFSMAKQRNMIGILRPTDEFGPPSIEERILRILYNPRFEVRYKRRLEVCTHKCLLDCESVKTAVDEEIDLLQNIVTELRHSKSDKALVESIVSKIQAHQKNLTRAIFQNEKKKEKNKF